MINESVVQQNDTELWHSSQLINLGLDRLYNVGALCLFVFYSQCIMRHPFIINNAQSKYYTHGLTKRPQQKYSNLFLVTGAFWITLCSKRSLWPKLHIECMIHKYLQSLMYLMIKWEFNKDEKYPIPMLTIRTLSSPMASNAAFKFCRTSCGLFGRSTAPFMRRRCNTSRRATKLTPSARSVLRSWTYIPRMRSCSLTQLVNVFFWMLIHSALLRDTSPDWYPLTRNPDMKENCCWSRYHNICLNTG